MNNARAPFDDIRVREAVAHAIDRQAIIDGAMFGYGTPIGSHFAPHHPAYVDLTGARRPTTRRRRRRCSPRPGVADGFDDDADAAAAVLCPARRRDRRARSCARSASRPQIVNVEWAQWLEQVFKNKDFDLTIVSHTEPMDIEHLRPARLLLRLRRPGDAGADGRGRRHRRPGGAGGDPAGGAGAGGAEQFVNVFLFQLAKTGVADARLRGLWANSPTQANDMTGVSWAE